MKHLSCYLFIFFLPFCAMAQQSDTVQTKSVHPIRPFIIPAVFIGYGMISLGNNTPLRKLDVRVTNEIKRTSPNSFTSIDDYLRYVPAAAVYGLNLAGIKGKNNLLDATAIYVLSTGISGGITVPLKRLTDRTRPDQSDSHSFPSGHSTTAFASAEFLMQEYKDVSSFYGYAGYTVATATAVLRLYNKKHWLSDVVGGAGVGILSTKLSYLLYPKIKQLFSGTKQNNFSLIPSYQERTYGLAFTARL
jgi:membrane-associated phospholipid phosphatase